MSQNNQMNNYNFLFSSESIFIPLSNNNNNSPTNLFSNIFNVLFDSFTENDVFNDVIQISMDSYNDELFKKINDIYIDLSASETDDSMKNKNCFICLENLVDSINNRVYKLKCNHIFHKKCLDKAISHQHYNCCICKGKIPIKKMEKEEYENENGHKISMYLK